MKNGVETILEAHGFIQVFKKTKSTSINTSWENGKSMKFSLSESLQSNNDSFVLTKSNLNFGFVSETYIMWDKYEKCLKELEQALNWMYETINCG